MPEPYLTIFPPGNLKGGSPEIPGSILVQPPGSKSISNRAILCASLAMGTSELIGLLDSEDTRLMAEACGVLGATLKATWSSGRMVVTGVGGPFKKSPVDPYCGNSGTTIRFLTAVLAAGGGAFRLDGNSRMRQRPISDLLDSVRQMGTHVKDMAGTGCPPIELQGARWAGGELSVKGDISSQFLSGLLMAAPLARGTMTIRLQHQLVSRPYVDMTLGVMERFGVFVERRANDVFVLRPAQYRATQFEIEPDASAASYFFAAAAIQGTSIRVEGLGLNSIQGDLKFVELLRRMGCHVEVGVNSTVVSGPARFGIDCAMNEMSDTAMTLATVAAFVDGPTTIRDVEHIRNKESDRIADLARELRRVGLRVEEFGDGLRIIPGPVGPARLQTYDDHRLAMSLALLGLKVGGLELENPACVGKTYPEYFRDLSRVTGCLIRWPEDTR